MKYRIIQTTDGKYEGQTVELTPSPLKLEDFDFHYEKKQTDGETVILSNSNYIINLQK